MGTCYTMKFNKKKNDDDYDSIQQPTMSETMTKIRRMHLESELRQKQMNNNSERQKQMKKALQEKLMLKSGLFSTLKLEDQIELFKKQFVTKLVIEPDGIYSNYLLHIFMQNFQDTNQLKQLIKQSGVQQIVRPQHNSQSDEFITCGINIEEILCKFLNQHSQKFSNFSFQEKAQVDESMKVIDYKIQAQDELRQKVNLDVKFFIADIHNNPEMLIKLIHQVQVYKILQSRMPIKIHEEIFECTHDSLKGISRYCLIYEIQSKENHGIKTVTEQVKAWHKIQTQDQEGLEQFSLEKLIYLTLQMMLIIIDLQQLDMYSYLEFQEQSLLINSYGQLLLSSNYELSYKLIKIKKSDITTQEKQQEITNQQELYLIMSIMSNTPEQYDLKEIVYQKNMPDHNNNLQIALITQKIFEAFEQYHDIPVIKESFLKAGFKKPKMDDNTDEDIQFSINQSVRYQEDLRDLIKIILKELKDPKLNLNLKDVYKNIFIRLYETGVFVNLLEQFYIEKKYKQITYLFEIILSSNQLKNDEIFQSKFYILLFAGKAYIKLNMAKEALKTLEECYEYYLLKSDNGVSIRYQYEEMLVSYERSLALLKSGDKIKALEQAIKIQQTNHRKFSEYNQFSMRCLNLLYKCHLENKDYEKALKNLELKLNYQQRIYAVNPFNLNVAKTHFKIGKTLHQLGKYKIALAHVESAQKTFERVLGEGSIKSMEILKELAQVQIKCENYNLALKNYKFLLAQHEMLLSPYHVEIFQDNKFIGQCAIEDAKYDIAHLHLMIAIRIAEKVFIIPLDENNTSKFYPKNKDSVFNSLDIEHEQFSYVNYLLGQVNFKGLKNFEQADFYFETAQRHIQQISNLDSQQEYIAQIQYHQGQNLVMFNKPDKARKLLEHALDYFKRQDQLEEYYYKTSIDIFMSLISIKKSLDHDIPAQISAEDYIVYIKSAIVKIKKLYLKKQDYDQRFEVFEQELDLVKAYNQLLYFYMKNKNDNGKNNIKIQEILEDQLRVYKTAKLQYEKIAQDKKRDQMDEGIRLLNKKTYDKYQDLIDQYSNEYLLQLAKIGDFFLIIEEIGRAIAFYERAKKTYEGFIKIKDYQRVFEIQIKLANAYYHSGQHKECLSIYLNILNNEKTRYQDYLSALPKINQYQLHKRIGELFENIQSFKDSIKRYQRCLEILPLAFEIESDDYVDENIQLQSSLAYCCNSIGAIDMALNYQRVLHELNIKYYGQNHPNTFNSGISILKLLDKLTYNQSKQIYEEKQKLKIQVKDIVLALSEKYQDLAFDSDDLEFVIFKNYLQSQSIILTLNEYFQQDKDSSFKFLSEFNNKTMEKLKEYFQTIDQSFQSKEKVIQETIKIKKQANYQRKKARVYK
ncbi:tetratricopeptide repeat protein [Stylonychia lemnae]|uniref:Tetratricopeptide repeat protein n=1 Tax=Stylonychia lemnae TaxID=5949 RepID=A0A077ZXU7_STYLE|nr:tetratricopeptide repeat protein [Stylonychia lemnae]|eukprot:CDW74062.1 tetratricopeptide repeat protein [Stylonychia lemnae]